MGIVNQTLEFMSNLILPPNPKVLTLGKQDGVSLPWPCDSIDISDYEGANIKWDLNIPIPQEWHNQYDLVIDGGTTEHIFNLLGALDNCYNLLKSSGHFVSQQTMNFCGHGFYQLCPEFWYKWARWKGMSNTKCWVYTPTGSGLKIVEERPERREEFETFSHLYCMFRAEKWTEQSISNPYPQQAGPSKASKFQHWFWNTKVWSRFPVPKEERVSRKIKL